MTSRVLAVLGRVLLSAVLMFLVLVVGFYSLYGARFGLDGGHGWGALCWVAIGGGIVFLLGWWIARLWRRKKATWP